MSKLYSIILSIEILNNFDIGKWFHMFTYEKQTIQRSFFRFEFFLTFCIWIQEENRRLLTQFWLAPQANLEHSPLAQIHVVAQAQKTMIKSHQPVVPISAREPPPREVAKDKCQLKARLLSWTKAHALSTQTVTTNVSVIRSPMLQAAKLVLIL